MHDSSLTGFVENCLEMENIRWQKYELSTFLSHAFTFEHRNMQYAMLKPKHSRKVLYERLKDTSRM